MRSGHKVLRWVGVIMLVFALGSLSPVSPVRAAIIVVDAAGDGDVPANAQHCPAVPTQTCTLRDAVAKAGSGDTINFASGLGTIHVSHTGGTITISHDLTIAGRGATTTIIDADADTQPFAITGPGTSSTGISIAIDATFQDLTIRDINITSSAIAGGAILVQSIGTLALMNVNLLTTAMRMAASLAGARSFSIVSSDRANPTPPINSSPRHWLSRIAPSPAIKPISVAVRSSGTDRSRLRIRRSRTTPQTAPARGRMEARSSIPSLVRIVLPRQRVS
jgi:hypothetical protein